MPDANGGEVVATGTAADIMACEDSLTGAYLSGRIKISVPAKRRKPTGWITVKGARENNLKNIDVDSTTWSIYMCNRCIGFRKELPCE